MLIQSGNSTFWMLNDILLVVKRGMKKYQKCYTFMDVSDAYYTTLVLDPRMKADILLGEYSNVEIWMLQRL